MESLRPSKMNMDAQIRFTTDASGVVAGAEFTQGELSLGGRHIDHRPAR